MVSATAWCYCCYRPPPNTPSGWDFCGWDCLQQVKVLVGEKGETKGVYEMEAV